MIEILNEIIEFIQSSGFFGAVIGSFFIVIESCELYTIPEV